MLPSLDRLSEKERALLRLLAQGHTAKTIANSQGFSVNVVNERLRSARRKTQASSSRELARLVAALDGNTPQESGNKFFGLQPAHSAGQSGSGRVIANGARRLGTVWGFVMSAAIMMAAAALAYVTASRSPADVGQASSSGQSPSGALIRLDTVGDPLYVVEGSVVRSDGSTLATMVKPLGGYGLMSTRIEVDCGARKWRATAISFSNQDGTPRSSSDMGTTMGWGTRNMDAIAEKVCV